MQKKTFTVFRESTLIMGMQRLIWKILWLEDKQIRRWGRLNGWACIVAGILMVCGWPFLHQYCANTHRTISTRIVAEIQEIADSPDVGEDTKSKLNTRADNLKNAFEELASGTAIFTSLLLLLGMLEIGWGFLYLRCHALFLEKERGGHPGSAYSGTDVERPPTAGF